MRAHKNQSILGFFYGLGKYGLGVSWVFISISNFSDLHWIFSALITLGFVCLLSLYEAFLAKIFFSLKQVFSNFQCGILFAALMTLSEILRATFMTGFPWLLAAHSQLASPLGKMAPILGTYAISFLCYWISTFIANAFLIPQKKLTVNYNYAAFILFPFFFCHFFLPSDWSTPIGKPLNVSLLQGNITHLTKWNNEQLNNTLATYHRLTMQRLQDDIIVWPETALPLPNIYAIDIFMSLKKNAIDNHASIILGAPGMNKDGSLSNSIFLLGKHLARYDKQHLVPFGEYMPIKFLHPLYQRFNIPFADLSKGEHASDLFFIRDVIFSPFICFEIAFNERTQLDRIKKSNAILTITDDSWFGHSLAKAQHLQIAQMRSLETSRPQLFASNDGLTAIINAKGQVAHTMPQSQEGYLHGSLQGQTGNPPFLLYGNTPIIVFLLLLVISLYLHAKYTHQQREKIQN